MSKEKKMSIGFKDDEDFMIESRHHYEVLCSESWVVLNECYGLGTDVFGNTAIRWGNQTGVAREVWDVIRKPLGDYLKARLENRKHLWGVLPKVAGEKSMLERLLGKEVALLFYALEGYECEFEITEIIDVFQRWTGIYYSMKWAYCNEILASADLAMDDQLWRKAIKVALGGRILNEKVLRVTGNSMRMI